MKPTVLDWQISVYRRSPWKARTSQFLKLVHTMWHTQMDESRALPPTEVWHQERPNDKTVGLLRSWDGGIRGPEGGSPVHRDGSYIVIAKVIDGHRPGRPREPRERGSRMIFGTFWSIAGSPNLATVRASKRCYGL